MNSEDKIARAEQLAEELMNQDRGNSGTGERASAGRDNPDRPGIAAMGGYAPNFAGDNPGDRTSTIIEKTDGLTEKDVLDETDQEYMAEYLQETEIQEEQ